MGPFNRKVLTHLERAPQELQVHRAAAVHQKVKLAIESSEGEAVEWIGGIGNLEQEGVRRQRHCQHDILGIILTRTPGNATVLLLSLTAPPFHTTRPRITDIRLKAGPFLELYVFIESPRSYSG